MQQVETRNKLTAGAARGPWWSSNRGQTTLRAIASCLAEILPVEAVLLVIAGADGNSPDQAAAPFWYLCVVVAVAWVLAYRMRRQSSKSILLASAAPFLVLYLLLLRISPAAFGDAGARFFDFSWLTNTSVALTPSGFQSATPLLLFLLVFYLWVRGASNALNPATPTTIIRRFAVYLCVLMLAVIGLNAVPPEVRAPYGAALTLLIIGEVFFVLVSAALAQLSAQRRMRSDAEQGDDTRWVGTALLVALGVVTIALFVSLLFGFDSFLALLGYLGPVGIAIGHGLTWLLNLLGQIIGPLLNRIQLIGSNGKSAIKVPPNPQYGCFYVIIHGKRELDCSLRNGHSASGLAQVILDIVILLLLAVIGLILFLVVRHVLTRYRHLERFENGDEREALDGRALFAAQMRGLLDRLRWPAGAAPDPLQRGSVRYMYRELLRSAKSRGLDRAPAETPDEYATQLAKSAPLALYTTGEGDDLVALSDAYNGARYADREPDAATLASLQARTHRLTRLFGG